MTAGNLRTLLEQHAAATGLDERNLWDRPRLRPRPRVDSRFADLFRGESLDEAGRLWGEDVPRMVRWRRFLETGLRRRRLADLRQALDDSLAQLPAGDGGAHHEAAQELAAALESADDAGEAVTSPTSPAFSTGNRISKALNLSSRIEAWAAGAGDESAATDRCLPAAGHGDLWRVLKGPARFLRRGDGRVLRAPASSSGAVAESVPQRIHLLVREAAGVEAYAASLEAAGSALALAHLPVRLPAEDRWLPADGGARIYGRLWARRLLNRRWLEARGIEGLQAAQVVRAGRRAGAAKLMRWGQRAASSVPIPDGGWGWLAAWPGDTSEAVLRASDLPDAASLIDGEQVAALLDHYLRRRWGELWDQRPQAADLLRQLWSEGWARPVRELLSFLGEKDPDGDALEEEYAAPL